MSRTYELTDKNMEVLREGDQTKVQKEKRHGVLKDYTLQHRVEIRWDMNDESIRDRMFILKVGDNEVILDAEELHRYLRWV